MGEKNYVSFFLLGIQMKAEGCTLSSMLLLDTLTELKWNYNAKKNKKPTHL